MGPVLLKVREVKFCAQSHSLVWPKSQTPNHKAVWPRGQKVVSASRAIPAGHLAGPLREGQGHLQRLSTQRPGFRMDRKGRRVIADGSGSTCRWAPESCGGAGSLETMTGPSLLVFLGLVSCIIVEKMLGSICCSLGFYGSCSQGSLSLA